MSKEEVVSQLKDLAKLAGEQFVTDVIDLIQADKAERLIELTIELTNLKVDALTADDVDDRRLYVEMIEDKLGSLAHVVATEGIVASNEIGAMLATGARTMLSGFGIVAGPMIKLILTSTLGVVGGAVLGELGDKLVDTVVDAAIDSLSPE